MLSSYKTRSFSEWCVIVFSALVFVSAISAIGLESPFPLLIPPALLVGYVAIVNVRHFYYLFFFLLPFSVELYLPNGLGTDLPSEPLMIGLSFSAILLFLTSLHKIPQKYIYHPLVLILLSHVGWVFVTSITAQNQVISIKYLIAKLWYIIPFFFYPLFLFRGKKEIIKCFKFFFIGMSLAALYVMVRHATMGFSFDMINRAGSPIFRNHVAYAAIMALSLPFAWALKNQSNCSKKESLMWSGLIVFFLIAIYLTYTRAAYVTVLMAIAAYYVIRSNYTKQAILASVLIAAVSITYYLNDNKYLDLAPEYERTISHDKFGNLISATYKMEDLSTMERVYRWVAGYHMIKDKPIVGFGPGNFYDNYQAYSVSSFKTYVSFNPDKSGIHNYFLMCFVEQGALGFFIILFLVLYSVILGSQVYHKTENEDNKKIIMAAILSLIVIDAFILINDLLETDKVGTFFFLNLAILIIFDLKTKNATSISKETK